MGERWTSVQGTAVAFLLQKSFTESQAVPFKIRRLSKPVPSPSLLFLVWWMKDGCDASEWNLQVADPLKPTSVNTNKTSLNVFSSFREFIQPGALEEGSYSLRTALLSGLSTETETPLHALPLCLPCLSLSQSVVLSGSPPLPPFTLSKQQNWLYLPLQVCPSLEIIPHRHSVAICSMKKWMDEWRNG